MPNEFDSTYTLYFVPELQREINVYEARGLRNLRNLWPTRYAPSRYRGFNPERPFGVEIECVGMSYRAQDQLNELTRVEVGSDSSIYAHPFYPNGAREIRIGPISVVGGGKSTLQRVCNILRENHVSVNRSCGLHVHHDISRFDRSAARTIAYRTAQAYHQFAPAIELFFRPHRWRNEYALSLIRSDEYRNEWASDYVSRYWAVNGPTHHGTIEFRQHHGTVSFDRIYNWVRLTNMLVEYALSVPSLTWRSPQYPMQALWRALVLPGDRITNDTRKYYLREARRLAKQRQSSPPLVKHTRRELLDKKHEGYPSTEIASGGYW